MDNKEQFNQSKYVQDYMKTHYKEMKIRFKPDVYNALCEYCDKYDKSKQGLIIEAVKNYIGFIEDTE